jgi:ketosteroid isomerase-like protein
MASFYAQDAQVTAPDTDVVRGQHAIEAFFKAASQAAQRTGMRRTIHVRQVERSGDLGYVLSTVVLELPAADGQATTTFNDVTVWKLEHDGGFDRSAAITVAVMPCAVWSRSPTSRSFPWLRATSTRLWPSPASSRASSRPMPPEAPVTSAVCFIHCS